MSSPLDILSLVKVQIVFLMTWDSMVALFSMAFCFWRELNLVCTELEAVIP